MNAPKPRIDHTANKATIDYGPIGLTTRHYLYKSDCYLVAQVQYRDLVTGGLVPTVLTTGTRIQISTLMTQTVAFSGPT